MARARAGLGAIGGGVALLVGVLVVQWLPVLPPRWSMLVLAMAAVLAGWRWPRVRWLSMLLCGFAWAAWRGSLAMGARLPRDLEGHDFQVTGQVVGLPERRAHATAFRLRVEHAALDGRTVALHGLLRLAWYGKPPVLQPCSRWRLVLRLKRPRGMIDPGGADSERSALERRIVAVGYVREDPANAPRGSPAFCVDRLRGRLANGIAWRVPDVHDAALLRAFTVGDTRGLDERDWEVARANGVSHLIAISGFHVGVAAVFGVMLARLLYLAWPGLALRWPRPPAQAAAALLTAFAYGALAGFGLPTVRTLLMIAVVALARCGRRRAGGAHALALAMIAMLLFDPLAVLSAGFWLSFAGVAFLLLCLDGRGRGWRAFLHELSAGQLVMTVSLLPLGLWFFGQASLVGALSNLVAVPFVSFAIVPCALLGLLLLLACPSLAWPLLRLAGWMAHAQWWVLERMAAWPGAHWYLPTVQPWALLLAMLGAVWLFLPRGMPLRVLGLLLFLPLLWPPLSRPAAGAFHAWVLDVGQGLSVVVRTRHHVLVYDAGARYPSGFDLGEAVVAPSLHALGIGRLDMLMISHADNDHAGGAAAVAAAFPAARRYAGEVEKMALPMAPCLAGQAWTWDRVRFRVINPPSAAPSRHDNDRSCVLLVEGTGGRLLLPGDISTRVEPRVAASVTAGTPLVLVVPHHGSKTSSGEGFITALRPRLAIVSAGWRNRFGHPRPEVLRRYAAAGVPVLNTAVDGAIELAFPARAGPYLVARWRWRQPRYWRE